MAAIHEECLIFADPVDLRQMQELHHHNLRNVSITGFSSAKSLVELTCHVLKSIISLECLTLEAPQSCVRCSDPANKSGKCSPLALDILMEGHRAVMAIRKCTSKMQVFYLVGIAESMLDNG